MLTQQVLPQDPKGGLSDPGEESGGEGEPQVLGRVRGVINLVLEQSTQQERHHSHWSYGYVS